MNDSNPKRIVRIEMYINFLSPGPPNPLQFGV